MRLVARWREGWRREVAVLEVWSKREQRLLAEFDAAEVLLMLRHHLEGVELSARLRAHLDVARVADPPVVPELPRKPLRAVNGRKLRGRSP